jgi:hypothetical protein
MNTPLIDMQPPVHPSSQVKLVGYYAPTLLAVISFPGPTLYHYQNVPEARFEEIRTAASPGKALAAIFKSAPDTYPCHKVVEGVECECFEVKGFQPCPMCREEQHGKCQEYTDTGRACCCGALDVESTESEAK